MEIHFTRHALARMQERGITADEVRGTLEHPLQRLEAKEGSMEAQGWLERDVWSAAMKFEYDPQADALYIRLAVGLVADTEEVRPGLMLDYDADGKILGIEMLDVSKTADNPRELAMEVLASA